MDNEMLLQQARDYVAQESDSFFKNQIESLIEKGDYNELNDRFYTELEFGTGGIRGVIGGGYNRMNPLVVRKATQGLTNYIKKAGLSREPSVVIAYDSRHFSDLFALEAARVLRQRYPHLCVYGPSAHPRAFFCRSSTESDFRDRGDREP